MSDIISVKAGAAIQHFPAILAKVKLIAGGRVSNGFIKILIELSSSLRRLQAQQGDVGLILYLKAAQVALQQACAGYKVRNMRPLGARISRTKGALLPRIIHPSHRKIIINDMPGKYFIIKFYLTLFYCYRVIVVPKYKVNLDTILKPGVPNVLGFIPVRYYDMFLKAFIRNQSLLNDPLSYFKKVAKLFSILKSSPNNLSDPNISLWSTHPLVMMRSLFALVKSNFIDEFRSLASHYHPQLMDFIHSLMENSNLMSGSKPGLSIGKLSFKEEPAGKLRVFAIVDCFTQWLFYPLHKLIFKILKSIPMDGTFNQLKPVHRLLRLKAKEFYSLDLSAATDRLPLLIQQYMLTRWITQIPYFGDCWASILVKRSYRFFADPRYDNSKHGIRGSVKYAVGQPMGALSSWAMLALTHHFLVQVSAWQIGFVKPGRLYRNYALLGDDLVICDRAVAKSYLRLMSQIGVTINLNKSILSPSGKGLEFAKRTFIDGIDVSPISFRDLSLSLQPGNTSHWVAFSKAHNLSFALQAKVLGYGFRANKSSFRKMNAALKAVWLSNVAKVDFNSQTLELARRVPLDLSVNVSAFINTVLFPIWNDLHQGFGDDFVSLSVEDRVWMLEQAASEVVMSWASSHFSQMDFIVEKHEEISKESDFPIDNDTLYSEMIGQMCFMHKELVKSECPHVLESMREALDFLQLESLGTLTECLQTYLTVTKLKAVQSLSVYSLDDKVGIVPSKKLPFQVRMFRKWAKVVHSTLKLSKHAPTIDELPRYSDLPVIDVSVRDELDDYQ